MDGGVEWINLSTFDPVLQHGETFGGGEGEFLGIIVEGLVEVGELGFECVVEGGGK